MSVEEAVWTGHPSHWHYFLSWVLGILLLPIGIGLFILIWIFVDRSRRTYTVTPTKVIVEWGLVAKNSDEVRIKDIRSISVRRSGLLGLMGIGDVEFASAAADQAEIIFRSISDAAGVRDRVRGYQEA
jgi:uncharacterized membrane protein YdbT with pleckstrin-like domain